MATHPPDNCYWGSSRGQWGKAWRRVRMMHAPWATWHVYNDVSTCSSYQYLIKIWNKHFYNTAYNSNSNLNVISWLTLLNLPGDWVIWAGVSMPGSVPQLCEAAEWWHTRQCPASLPHPTNIPGPDTGPLKDGMIVWFILLSLLRKMWHLSHE